MWFRMENFSIIGVPWKIWFLKGVTKNQYVWKGGLGQFANLRKGLAKKRVFGYFEGGLIPQCTVYDKSFLSIFHKMLSKIFCSKICWQNSAKGCFMYRQWTATVLKFLKVPTTNCLTLFSEYISRTAILTQALVITCK